MRYAHLVVKVPRRELRRQVSVMTIKEPVILNPANLIKPARVKVLDDPATSKSSRNVRGVGVVRKWRKNWQQQRYYSEVSGMYVDIRCTSLLSSSLRSSQLSPPPPLNIAETALPLHREEDVGAEALYTLGAGVGVEAFGAVLSEGDVGGAGVMIVEGFVAVGAGVGFYFRTRRRGQHGREGEDR